MCLRSSFLSSSTLDQQEGRGLRNLILVTRHRSTDQSGHVFKRRLVRAHARGPAPAGVRRVLGTCAGWPWSLHVAVLTLSRESHHSLELESLSKMDKAARPVAVPGSSGPRSQYFSWLPRNSLVCACTRPGHAHTGGRVRQGHRPAKSKAAG